MHRSHTKHHNDLGLIMKKKPTAIALGELRWEDVRTAQTLGGSAAVFACRLAALGVSVRLAARLGADSPGNSAIALLKNFGVDVGLIQRELGGTTNCVAHLSVSEPVSPQSTSDSHLEVEPSADLLSSANDDDILYFHSFMQGGRSSGEALRQFVTQSGPSFKIYDIDCSERVPTREQLEAGFAVASAVYVRGEELPVLCDLLGLPLLEPGLFASAIIERFGPSYCLVADPFAGALIASIVGEQVGIGLAREETVDVRGWHEAYLAAFVYHVFRGSSLSHCCAAGMRYGDLVAMTSGALEPLPAELIALVTSVE